MTDLLAEIFRQISSLSPLGNDKQGKATPGGAQVVTLVCLITVVVVTGITIRCQLLKNSHRLPAFQIGETFKHTFPY